MAIYTVHEPPRLTGDVARDADRFRFVRDGFYGWAFLLPPVWMLVHRLWLVLLGYLIAAGLLEAALILVRASTGTQTLAFVLLSILIGTEAGTLRRWTLARRRYRPVGVVVGDDIEAAERRFFSTWDVARAGPRSAAAVPAAPGIAARSVYPGGIVGLFPEPGASR